MNCNPDYTIFYKEVFDPKSLGKLPSYDLFLSAYDDSERTGQIFLKIKASEKLWFSFPHYGSLKNKTDKFYESASFSESDYFVNFLTYFDQMEFDKKRICIDITGFIRPHLIYLLRFLSSKRISSVDFLYTEPMRYQKSEHTKFSGFVDIVRDVDGCSSVNNNPNMENDLLIVATGYDDDLIEKISQNKKHCRNRYYILGFPSLQPDMYQESILKIENAKDSIGEPRKQRFAPACDPFVTAQVVSEIVAENPNATNIFLSPLSTKPQTLGIGLFYVDNYAHLPLSIVFPCSNNHASNYTEGIKRTWKYTFEFSC